MRQGRWTSDPPDHADEATARRGRRGLAARLRAFGDRLFEADDARALLHGWEIEAGRHGLSRTYRDPRFDTLMACPQCRGSGKLRDDEACGRCSGTGRIRLTNSARRTELTRG